MAVSAGGFRISAESFRLAVTAAGMVSGFQSLCRQHHNMILGRGVRVISPDVKGCIPSFRLHRGK